ncbi:MAG: hypothetical protein ACTSVI_12485 [Promethearchaeota archaeon]
MLNLLKVRPSDGKLGIITLSALAVLSIFGLWIQYIERIVEVSGFGVLNVEFALTHEQMDMVIRAFLNHDVLSLEIFVGKLDFLITPGWSLLFFGCHLLGIRALQFLNINKRFREKTLKLTILPLVAGGFDTVENLIILYILTNPFSYVQSLVPFLIVLVLSKFTMLFLSIFFGIYANVFALKKVINKLYQKTMSVEINE